MANKKNVPKCDSFYDYITRINKLYGSMIAFKTIGNEWTYNDLYRLVSKVSSTLEDKLSIYCIDVKDPVLFFVAFMSITISGNIAWLDEKAVREQYIYIYQTMKFGIC